MYGTAARPEILGYTHVQVVVSRATRLGTAPPARGFIAAD